MNTLFTESLLSKTVKTATRLITHLSALLFLLISPLVFADDISRSEVQQIKVELGEKVVFQSKNLAESREFYLRLPKEYNETKHSYPVIYLLDANNETLTYMDNLYFHSITQIERLMEHGDIPQSIIVGIPFKSSQWFGNVISNPQPFRDYLTKELSTYVNDNYRTLNNNILIGQSYSAVFVINSLPVSGAIFNGYLAIEPVLGGGALETTITNFQNIFENKAVDKTVNKAVGKTVNITVNNSALQIIMGGAIMLHEVIELREQITNAIDKETTISLKTFPEESHGSVYYPALNYGLRKHFEDYRQPSKEQIMSSNFGHQELLNYFEKRASKYQVQATDRQFQSAVFETIFYQLMAKKFDQAFALWPVWQSPYKLYNADRIISHFLRENDSASAIALLNHLGKAMPASVSVVDRLAILYQQESKMAQAEMYRLKTQQLLLDIFSKPVSEQQEASLNSYGYSLLQQQRNQEAVNVFKQISQVKPASVNAFDSLADAYEATKNYQQAIKSLEQAMVIASNKDNVNTAPFEQKINRMKSIVNAE
ncbi:MAG: alpha/beta hydrolase-fold protein [Colwellia sp.]|nr:alpha/beta hydrolase-fold protein [Colwellia sp.]